jgi:hypothetical protein
VPSSTTLHVNFHVRRQYSRPQVPPRLGFTRLSRLGCCFIHLDLRGSIRGRHGALYRGRWYPKSSHSLSDPRVPPSALRATGSTILLLRSSCRQCLRPGPGERIPSSPFFSLPIFTLEEVDRVFGSRTGAEDAILLVEARREIGLSMRFENDDIKATQHDEKDYEKGTSRVEEL